MNIITKEHFAEILNSLCEELDLTIKLEYAINKYYNRGRCQGGVELPESPLSDIIVDIMSKIFDDKYGMIGEWVGNRVFDGCQLDCEDSAGNKIEIKTAENLYDVLVHNMNSHENNVQPL